jgi:hypothetical protein
MRKAWLKAFAAIGQSSPLTPTVWILWIALTLPMGIAIMAYAASHTRPARNTPVAGGLAVWLLLTLGMVGWGVHDSLPLGTLVMDSGVNLAALVAASVSGSRALSPA